MKAPGGFHKKTQVNCAELFNVGHNVTRCGAGVAAVERSQNSTTRAAQSLAIVAQSEHTRTGVSASISVSDREYDVYGTRSVDFILAALVSRPGHQGGTGRGIPLGVTWRVIHKHGRDLPCQLLAKTKLDNVIQSAYGNAKLAKHLCLFT